MKKGFLTVFLMLVMLLVFSGCASESEASVSELVIGCDNYRPYHYIDENGNPAGIDVDIAKEACKRLGYIPVFKQIDWSKRKQILADGEVDCLWSCLAMDDEDAFIWIGPYMYSRQVVAVRADSPLMVLDDLQGKRIAVKTGSKAEKIFLEQAEKDIPKVQSVYCLNSADDVITALRNDYVDACAGYAATMIEMFQSTGMSYRFLDEDLVQAEIGVAFPKDGNAEFIHSLAYTLEEMRFDGAMKRILESYGLNANKSLGRFAHE